MVGSGQSRSQGVAMVLAATACWSTAGVWVQWIVEGGGVSALTLAFWRDIVTFALLLTGVALLQPILLRVSKRDLPFFAVMGAIGIGAFHVLWNLSVIFNGVAIATVLQYNAPIIVTVVAWITWGEPLTLRKVLAIALALSGTALIALTGGAVGGMHITLEGVAVGLASAAAISVYSLLGKRLTGAYSPWSVVTYVFGFGALALLPFYLSSDDSLALSWPVLGAFAGFVFIPTLGGFSLYTNGLPRLQASIASILATTEVAFAALASYLIVGERFSGSQIVGAALVVMGVFLVSVSQARWRALALRLRAAVT